VYAVRQGARVALQMPDGLTILRWPDPQGRWAVDGSLGSAAVTFATGPAGAVTGFDLLNVRGQPAHFDRVTAAPGLPRVETLVKTAAFPDALQFTGTLAIGSLEGTLDVVAASGGRLASTVSIATTKERTVVDGRTAWTSSAGQIRELQGPFLEQVRLAHPFVRYGDRRTAYASLTVDRRDTVDGKDVWVIRAASRELPPATLYFAVESGLLLREDTWLAVRGMGLFPHTARFDDYRAVGDVQLPFRIATESAVSGKRQIRYTTIAPVTVTDKTFVRPD